MVEKESRSLSSAVSTLLKNIADGLTVLSIDDLNKAIAQILIRNKSKSTDIEQLFSIICKEYKITKKALMEKYSRDSVYHAKITLFVIMNQQIGMSRRSIAKLFDTFPNSVNVGINIFDKMNPEKFKEDKDFMSRYQKCLSSFLNKIQ